MQHFAKIGTGDVLALAQEIEKEKVEREKAALEAASQPQTSVSPAPPGDGAKGERGDSAANGRAAQVQKDIEGDVKMEER